jgi:hypothetical protein
LTQGFPAITVPAGFTTRVYDRIRDPNAPPPPPGWVRGPSYGGETEPTVQVGPTEAQLPVGLDISGRPFSEPLLITIASAFENATHHRHPPPEFGPVAKAR